MASGAIADGPGDLHLEVIFAKRALHATGDRHLDPISCFSEEGPVRRAACFCNAQEGVAYLPEDGVFTCLTVDVFP